MQMDQIETLEVVSMGPRITGIRVGTVVGIGTDGRAIVDYPGNPYGPLLARRAASVSAAAVAHARRVQADVLLTFQDQSPGLPILFDVMADESESPRDSTERPVDPTAAANEPPATRTTSVPGTQARIARIVSVDEHQVLIDFPGNPLGPLRARTAVTLRNLRDDVLVIMTDEGRVIVGQVYDGVPVARDGGEDGEVVLRGNSIRIEATDEIVLAAGASQMHLDARGKLTTTADQVVSRARGVNKVQGGCIKLN